MVFVFFFLKFSVAASQLNTLGCPELIARSRQEYEQIAIRLGNDREYLRSMRHKVWKARADSPLFDCHQYANGLENLFLRMWDRHSHGECADHITNTDKWMKMRATAAAANWILCHVTDWNGRASAQPHLSLATKSFFSIFSLFVYTFLFSFTIDWTTTTTTTNHFLFSVLQMLIFESLPITKCWCLWAIQKNNNNEKQKRNNSAILSCVLVCSKNTTIQQGIRISRVFCLGFLDQL